MSRLKSLQSRLRAAFRRRLARKEAFSPPNRVVYPGREALSSVFASTVTHFNAAPPPAPPRLPSVTFSSSRGVQL